MKLRGSVTVFLALLLTCVFSGIFALLEAARVSALRANARMSTFQAGDGLLSSYSRPLWDRYRLLFREGDFPELDAVEELQCRIIAGNRTQEGVSLQNFHVCSVNLQQVQVKNYQLATDGGGAAFRAQAAEAMRGKVAQEALQQITDMMDSSGSAPDEESVKRQEETALQTLEDLKKNKKSKEAGSPGSPGDGAGADTSGARGQESGNSGAGTGQAAGAEGNSGAGTGQAAGAEGNSGAGTGQAAGKTTHVEVSENPLEWMKKVKAKGIFAYLLPEEDLSDKKIDLSGTIARRKLRKGTLTEGTKNQAFDKLLFRLYLEEYLANVTESPDDAALDYEMEYLIAGRASDRSNLRAVVNRLLLLREGINFLYLQTDAEKREAAYGVALAITGAFGQPELAEPVRQAVLAAWAYAESLSDLRILLNGGKVSLSKTKEQWHTQIGHLSASVEEAGAKKQEQGLSYDNYLQLLLWTMTDKTLSYRAMDLMEKNAGVRMDDMIVRMNCDYEYEAKPLFWTFVRIGHDSLSGFRFEDQRELSYLRRQTGK